jgi:tRNA dimethylallyltransferase
MNVSKKLFVITGPTGIGKTDLLYRYLNQQEQIFEVVSLDSRQVYRYMSIGTASPDPYIKKKRFLIIW